MVWIQFGEHKSKRFLKRRYIDRKSIFVIIGSDIGNVFFVLCIKSEGVILPKTDYYIFFKKTNSLRLVSFCKLNEFSAKLFNFFWLKILTISHPISQPVFRIIQQQNSRLLFKSLHYFNFLSFIHSSINAFLMNKQKEAKNISKKFEIFTKPSGFKTHTQNQVFTQNSCSLFKFYVNIRRSVVQSIRSSSIFKLI